MSSGGVLDSVGSNSERNTAFLGSELSLANLDGVDVVLGEVRGEGCCTSAAIQIEQSYSPSSNLGM